MGDPKCFAGRTNGVCSQPESLADPYVLPPTDEAAGGLFRPETKVRRSTPVGMLVCAPHVSPAPGFQEISTARPLGDGPTWVHTFVPKLCAAQLHLLLLTVEGLIPKPFFCGVQHKCHLFRNHILPGLCCSIDLRVTVTVMHVRSCFCSLD